MVDYPSAFDDSVLEAAAAAVAGAERVVVLTGAGISTDSGIPDFRGPSGVWTKNPAAEKASNIQHYLADPEVRRAAWLNRLDTPMWTAEPNLGHQCVYDLERQGRLHGVITQNVDGLHQAAGHDPELVIEVHGTVRWTRCLECGDRRPMRETLDRVRGGEGDPPCLDCGGILKSDTISFGQSLIPEVIDKAMTVSEECDVMLAVGSTLSVFPAAHCVPIAKQNGATVIIVNGQPTDMDAIADHLLIGMISEVLPTLVGAWGGGGGGAGGGAPPPPRTGGLGAGRMVVCKVAAHADKSTGSAGVNSSATAASASPVLDVRGLATEFDTPDGIVHAVNGVSFEVRPGEFLGVVGESGSGKSVTMMSLLRLIPMPPGRIVSGEAHFGGQDLLAVPVDDLRRVRGGEIGTIFQDPMTSLNPVLTVGKQITESLRLHLRCDRRTANDAAARLLDRVGLPDAEQRLKSYPHELSGGMRQRVMIAIALACSPQLIIADEPTTALDVTVQAQIIDIVHDLREQFGTAMIWITHDLGVVAGLADRVLVMYGGKIVEEARVADLYATPRHPYTQGLLRSLPRPDQKGTTLVSIDGNPPNLYSAPTGCTFAPRCPYAFERCRREVPPLVGVGAEHSAACWWDTELDRERPVEVSVV